MGARGKAPFRAAECVYERFWSGMGTRNDEPGPGDHPASVIHTTPHRANKEQGEREREKSNNNALCARPNFLPLPSFSLLLLSFLHLPLLNFWVFLYINFFFSPSASFFRVSSSFFGVGSGSVSVSLVAALFLHLVFALSSACF